MNHFLNNLLEFISSFNFLRISLFVLIAVTASYAGYLFYLKKINFLNFNRFQNFLVNKKKIIFLIEGFLILIFLAGILTIGPKIIYPTDPSLMAVNISETNPLEIDFDRPVFSADISIDPPIAGKWIFSSGILRGDHSAVFVPDETFNFDTRYTVYVQNFGNLLSKKSDFLFSVATKKAPTVSSISPKKGDSGVLENANIIVNFSEKIDQKRMNIEAELSPTMEIRMEYSDNQVIIIPKEKLTKGVEYNIKIFSTLISTNNVTNEETIVSQKSKIYESSFKTADAMGILSYAPIGSGILTENNIKIIFKQNMNKAVTEKYFSITPKVSGRFFWTDKRTLTYWPDGGYFTKNTKYTVSVKKEAKTESGEGLEEDFSFNFTTIGYVTVSKFTPGNGSGSVGIKTAISVVFNQPVDHSSAESKFSLSPKVSGGNFSWSGNEMIYSGFSMQYSNEYTVKIDSGVKSIYGLNSKVNFTSKFTTGSQSTTLNVPAYRQAHMYSCMGTAARGALAFFGVYKSEDTILNAIGYDKTPWSGTWNELGSTWGDPEVGIVGSVDGKADNIGWGYGSHWTPVAKAIRSFGREAEVKTGWNASGIASEISAGHPVIIWWVNGVWPAYRVVWYKNGKKINAVNSMHVVVVRGFTGTIENPLTFSVTDSGYGYPGRSYDLGTFEAKWSWLNNTAIVVK